MLKAYERRRMVKEETWRTADMSWLDELQHEIKQLQLVIKQLQDEKLAQGAVKEFMEGSLNSIIRDLREENQILKDDWAAMKSSLIKCKERLEFISSNSMDILQKTGGCGVWESHQSISSASETLANLKFKTEVKE